MNRGKCFKGRSLRSWFEVWPRRVPQVRPPLEVKSSTKTSLHGLVFKSEATSNRVLWERHRPTWGFWKWRGSCWERCWSRFPDRRRVWEDTSVDSLLDRSEESGRRSRLCRRVATSGDLRRKRGWRAGPGSSGKFGACSWWGATCFLGRDWLSGQRRLRARRS